MTGFAAIAFYATPTPKPIVTIAVIVATAIVTILTFNRTELRRKLWFNVSDVLYERKWWQLFSVALVHGSWGHLIFNMLTLYFFGAFLELVLGPMEFLGLYAVFILLSSLFSLFMKRKNPIYTAVGASGGVAGILYSYIMLDPEGSVRLFFAIEIPNWLFGIGYVWYSIFGMRRQNDNIGHDAHLGGALAGALAGVLLNPGVLQTRWWMVLLMVIPVIVFVFLMEFRPDILARSRSGGGRKFKVPSHFEKGIYVEKGAEDRERAEAEELDALLDKIAQNGPESLSRRERKRLEELSDKKKD